MTRELRACVALAVVAALAAFAPAASATATIQIVNGDGAGEGLNDTTPVAPVGGNPATTLGNARLGVLQQAFAAVACHLDSAVPIQVAVTFDPLNCNANGAVLGTGTPTSVSRNFPNAPRANTYYPMALANSIAGVDLDPQKQDVTIVLSSTLGQSGCLTGSFFYYGFDGQSPAVDIDLFTIAMHELTHGLGFVTFVNATTGAKFGGLDDSYMVNLTQNGASPSSFNAMTDAERVAASISEPNLVWTGSNLVGQFGASSVFAPNPVQAGSSLSHTSANLYPNELMSPFYSNPTHQLGRAGPALTDQGWSSHPQCAVAPPPGAAVPATPPWLGVLLATCLMALAWGATTLPASASVARDAR